MKNLLVIPLLLIICSSSFAQGVTISVKSSTTVDLKASSIIYTVPQDPGESSMFGALDMFEEDYEYEEDNTYSLEEIADALSKDGYSYHQVMSDSGPKYEVSVSDQEQLNAVQELMLLLDATGAVTDVVFESPESHYEAIFKTLSEDAAKQAEMLATANNKKVIALISIEEPQQASFDMSTYMDMFKQGGAMMEMLGMGGPTLTKEYTKELIFTFSVSY